jgi:hypothetical protein
MGRRAAFKAQNKKEICNILSWNSHYLISSQECTGCALYQPVTLRQEKKSGMDMIYKDLDPFSGQDKFGVAGRRAEEQMAFYLRRFFASSAEVDVLNSLRIELGGEVAQMDHLVLHPFGLLIVESKSVVESVQIESDGQWIRWFNNHPQGMRSPITQARMQAMLLKALLDKAVKQEGVLTVCNWMCWLPSQTKAGFSGLPPARCPRCARPIRFTSASARNWKRPGGPPRPR